ncbi:hypothetical protein C5B41_15855 [Acinetobacter ursingii]|nr:hypothetical protein C5B41_15855 [Acinetobacter ursingii]
MRLPGKNIKSQCTAALLHKDLKCKAPLIEPNLRRNLGKEVRLYEIAKPLISDYFNGSITSSIRFSLL